MHSSFGLQAVTDGSVLIFDQQSIVHFFKKNPGVMLAMLHEIVIV